MADICTFHFRPADKTEPFSNRMGFGDGRRTLVGSDLADDTIVALSKVASGLSNVALRTRIADLVWSRDKRQAECARVAIDGYLDLVGKLVDGPGAERFHGPEPTGISAQEFLQRAGLIARSTGWSKSENDRFRQCFLQILELAFEKQDFAIVRFGNLAMDLGLSEAGELLSSLPDVVQGALAKPDFHLAESAQELVIRGARRSRDDEAVKVATLKFVEVLEAKGETAKGSPMLQGLALQQAISSLQNIKGVREVRQRLHEKLKDVQLHMFEEFGVIEHSMDLTDEVQRIIGGFAGLDLLESLLRLARTELPKNPDDLEREAIESSRRHPLSSLFATSSVDQKGRVVSKSPGGVDSPEGLRHEVIRAELLKTGIVVAAAIDPIRTEITKNFDIPYQVLYEICRLSPFVPYHATHIFARGIEAFLYGDDLIAVATLVPYLEAGLRQIVEMAGESETRIGADGIESVIGLGPLLGEYRSTLEGVIGKAMPYAIENFFEHEAGPKIRHHFCHGLTAYGAMFGEDHTYALKLLFTLVILPLAGPNWPAFKEEILARSSRHDGARSDPATLH
ncbi:hypothetical protein SPAN111604_04065 [Sphingomonas antarctica]